MKHEERELLLRAKEIIASGCSCDRMCEEFENGHPDFYCGCENDARAVIALVRANAE